MNKSTSDQNGSAMIYIFVGVALFGALMFIFSRGANQNVSSVTNQQSKIIASEILDYSRTVELSVNRLLAKGCSENQINFENSFESGYVNASAPTDKSCNVFDSAGGKVKYKYPSLGSETTYNPGGAAPGWKNYAFNGNMIIQDIASTNSELILWTMTNKAVCDEINSLIGQTTADETFADGVIGVEFTGTFQSSGPEIIGDDSYPPSISKGCFNRPVYAGQYIFYAVLVAR